MDGQANAPHGNHARGGPVSDKVGVLLAAGGARWEADALRLLSSGGITVLKRCVDLADLLATATVGQTDVAVVSGELSELDADAVMHLLRHDVRCVAVGSDRQRLNALGVPTVLDPADLAALPEAVESARLHDLVPDPDGLDELAAYQDDRRGRVIAVFGPAGAPGRTTVATTLAAERARHPDARAVLIDADPYGGTVAQQLGVLDETSGLLAAARRSNAGALDAISFAACRRAVGPGLEVLTGLPRPDRWSEVRIGAIEAIIGLASTVGDVVVDCGFNLEDDPGVAPTAVRPGRNQMTLDALAIADEVLVVGGAEPAGLARLARALVELDDVTAAPVRVLVNRMRDSLGWKDSDVAGMIEGYSSPLGIHFLPDDRPSLDRALVAGRSVAELGDSPFRRALAPIVAAVFEASDQLEKSR